MVFCQGSDKTSPASLGWKRKCRIAARGQARLQDCSTGTPNTRSAPGDGAPTEHPTQSVTPTEPSHVRSLSRQGRTGGSYFAPQPLKFRLQPVASHCCRASLMTKPQCRPGHTGGRSFAPWRLCVRSVRRGMTACFHQVTSRHISGFWAPQSKSRTVGRANVMPPQVPGSAASNDWDPDGHRAPPESQPSRQRCKKWGSSGILVG